MPSLMPSQAAPSEAKDVISTYRIGEVEDETGRIEVYFWGEVAEQAASIPLGSLVHFELNAATLRKGGGEGERKKILHVRRLRNVEHPIINLSTLVGIASSTTVFSYTRIAPGVRGRMVFAAVGRIASVQKCSMPPPPAAAKDALRHWRVEDSHVFVVEDGTASMPCVLSNEVAGAIQDMGILSWRETAARWSVESPLQEFLFLASPLVNYFLEGKQVYLLQAVSNGAAAVLTGAHIPYPWSW
mmetsp:Transcript_6132/g.15071  ORF Transcript_6132/g.15071 Transcript_6132/m.15071 type:complete len:243 (-) Transcript_6132:349-1077(-)